MTRPDGHCKCYKIMFARYQYCINFKISLLKLCRAIGKHWLENGTFTKKNIEIVDN